MTEGSVLNEKLSFGVKASSVENYTSRGYTPSHKEVADKLLNYSLVDNAVKLSPQFLSGEQRENGFTKMVLAPLSDKAFRQGLPEGISKQDTAVFFSYYGFQADASKRSPIMRAVVVMSASDASRFAEEVKKDPTLFYSFLRQVNGGPIQMYDQSPMKIKPGQAIDILANTSVGGSMKENTASLPFPSGYNPNP